MSSYNDHARTCKRHHMDIMDDYLASIERKRKPIPKDGSCLFRAFSEQAFKTQSHHLYIREACVRYMKRNQAIFENFVDDPFDEYLHKMSNPKESADQIEISALSKMYSVDFYIYEQPGQSAKNVTENDFYEIIYLCHSGQKHYDSVYSIEYFKSYGICQSILYSILFENVLGMREIEEKKSINTFRMLCCPSTSDSSGNGNENENDDDDNASFPSPSFTISSIYEPSIGILSADIPPQDQLGLAYKLPISLDFVRGLDPSVYRNIDYDFWITIKRKQQYIDFAVAEGMQYLIGDRCLVVLSIYSKTLVSHVQEVSPENGPITVFIEALGGMHTIAVKNAKPLDTFSGSCRTDVWPSKWRRRPSLGESSWGYSRNSSSGRKYNKQRDQDSNGYSYSQRGLECSGTRKRSQSSFSDSNGEKSQYSSKTDLSRKSHDDYPSQKTNRYKGKSRWGSTSKTLSPHESIPDVGQGTLMNENDLQDDMWGDPSDYKTCKSTWIESNCSKSPPDQPHNGLYDTRILTDGSFPEEQWAECGNYNVLGDSNGSSDSNNTVYLNPNAQSTPPQDVSSGSCQAGQSPDDDCYHKVVQYAAEEMSNMTLDEYSTTQSVQINPVGDSGGYPQQPLGHCDSMQPQQPQQPQQNAGASGSVLNVQRPPGYFPYSGTVTMIDTEGKEMLLTENKNPFQYFYNLGIEYYRQLSGGTQRSGPIVMGGTGVPHYHNVVPPTPVVQPQQVGYVHASNNPTQFGPPQIQSQHPGGCVATIPHFHPLLITPSSRLSGGGGGGSQFQSNRVFVHVPPPQHTQQTQQHSQQPMQFYSQQHPPVTQHNDELRSNDNPESCVTESGGIPQQLTQAPQTQHTPSLSVAPPLASSMVTQAPVYPHSPTYLPHYQPYPAPYNQTLTVYEPTPGAGIHHQHYPQNQSVHVQSPRSQFQA